MRRFNKLEEAILKMIHKRSKLGNTIGVTWDEYGNPVPVINNEQSIIDYNKMEEESEMDNYNEMNNE
jgi:chorismate mutase